jgi:S-adenosylmethionine uptake transporter
MQARVQPATAYLVACLGIAIFSCMDAVMKGQSIAIGAYNAMLWRSVAGVAISGAMFLAARTRWPDRAMVVTHVKRSGAAAISVLLFFWGLVRVPMAEGIALCFLAPVFATLLAVPMLGERLRPSALVASAAAFAGVGVIVAGKTGAGAGPEAMHGAAAIVLAGGFYGYNLVLLRRSALNAGPVEITFFMHLVFLGLYALAAPILAEVPGPANLAWLTLGAVFATVSSLLLSWAYAHAEAQRLVTVEYTAFIWAAILGAIVFGESVAAATWVGAALIVAGCVVAARGGKLVGPATEAAA